MPGPDWATVEVDIDPALPPVYADEGLLERVVANVIDNALRHGRPVRRAGLSRQPDEPPVAVSASEYGGFVELRVVDHGRGVPKGTTDALFTPFQRPGDRRGSQGLGLGLSVAKGFIDAMDGTIRAEDTPGGGLTVIVSLPVYRPEITGRREGETSAASLS
jgi:two-component system sensor histidine kinase KdpD